MAKQNITPTNDGVITPESNTKSLNFDPFVAVIDGGIGANREDGQVHEDLLKVLRPDDNLIFKSRDYYRDIYLKDKFGDDVDKFNNFYDQMSLVYKSLLQEKEKSTAPMLNENYIGIQPINDDYQYQRVKPQKIDPTKYASIDHFTGKPVEIAHPDQQASMRNEIQVMDENGNIKYAPFNVENLDTGFNWGTGTFSDNDFVRVQDDKGWIWRKVPLSQRLYNTGELRSHWGDRTLAGGGLWDGPKGFMSSLFFENPATMLGTAKAMTQKFGGDEGSAVDQWFNNTINYFNANTFYPSEKVMKDGWFDSIHSLWYKTGQGLGQLLLQIGSMSGAMNLARLSKFGPGATKFAVGSMGLGVGTSQAVGDFYQSAIDAGIPENHAYELAFDAIPAVAITEAALSLPWMSKGLLDPTRSMLKKEITNNMKKYISKANLNTELGKQTFLKNIFEASKKTFQKAAGTADKYSFISKLRFAGKAGGMEGLQESLEEKYYQYLEHNYDRTKALKGSTPGKGKFGTTFAWWDERSSEAMKGGFVLGFLGGASRKHTGNPSFREIVDNTIAKDGEKGKDRLLNMLYDEYKRGKFGTAPIDPDGNAITDDNLAKSFEIEEDVRGLEDRKINTLSKAAYYQAVQSVNESFAKYKLSGIDNNPDIRDMLNDDVEILSEFMNLNAEIIEAKQKLKEIDDKLISDENNVDLKNDKAYWEKKLYGDSYSLVSDINDLKEKIKNTDVDVEIAGLKNELSKKEARLESLRNSEGYNEGLESKWNNISVPEEGSNFSKRVNDKIKNIRLMVIKAQNEVDDYYRSKGMDPNNALKQTKGYRNRLNAHYRRSFPNPYNLYNSMKTAYEDYKVKANDLINEYNRTKDEFHTDITSRINNLSLNINESSFSRLSEIEDELNKIKKGTPNEQVLLSEKNDILSEMNNVVEDYKESVRDIISSTNQTLIPNEISNLFKSKTDELNKQLENIINIKEQNDIFAEEEISDIYNFTNTNYNSLLEPGKRNMFENNTSVVINKNNSKGKVTGRTIKSRVKDGQNIQERAYKVSYTNENGDEVTETLFGDEITQVDYFDIGQKVNYKDKSGTDRQGTILKQIENKDKENQYLIADKNYRNENPNISTINSRDIEMSLDGWIDDNIDFPVFYVKNFKDTHDALTKLMQPDENGELPLFKTNVEDIQNGLSEDIEAINAVRDMFSTANTLNDTYIRKHKVKGDISISNSMKDYTSSNINELDAGLRNIQNEINKVVGNKSVYQLKARQANAYVNVSTLKALITTEGIDNKQNPTELQIKKELDILGITDMISSLRDIERIEDKSKNLTDDQKSDLKDVEKKLSEIEALIHKNRDKIFGTKNDNYANFREFVRYAFLSPAPHSQFLYNNIVENTYQFDLNDIFSINDIDKRKSGTFYLWAINYLSTIHGINIPGINNIRKSLANNQVNIIDETGKNTEFASTYEQINTANQVIAFLRQGTDLIDVVLEEEIADHKHNNRSPEHYAKYRIKNTMSLRGWYGTGKSAQIIPEAFRIINKINPNKVFKVLVVGNTIDVINNMKNNLKDLPNVNTTSMSDFDFFSNPPSNVDIVLYDESSLLEPSQILSLKEKLSDNKSKIVFIGDKSQMVPLSTGIIEVRHVDKAGWKTNPLTDIHSNDNFMIRELAEWALKATIDGNFMEYKVNNVSQLMPPAYFEDINGIRKGIEYHENIEKVWDQYVERYNIQNGKKKSIVFVDNDDANKFKTYVKSKYGEDVLNNNTFKDGIYVLDYEMGNKSIRSIQGLRSDEIYIGFDINDPKSKKITGKQGKIKGNLAYTAIGRVDTSNNSGFVSMKGLKDLQLKSKPAYWTDAETNLTVSQIRENFVDQIEYLDNIDQEYKGSDTIENENSKSDTKEDSKKVAKEKKSTPKKSKTDPEIETESKSGEYTVLNNDEIVIGTGKNYKVNDTYINPSNNKVIKIDTFLKHDNGKIYAELNGDIYSLDELNTTLQRFENNIDSKLDNIERFSNEAKHQKKGRVSLWGSSYTSIKEFSGEDSYGNAARKRAVSPILMSIDETLNMTKSLYYMKSGTLSDKDNIGEHLLVVRFEPNDQEQEELANALIMAKQEREDISSGSESLTEQALNEIILSLTKKEGLPEAYANFMVLSDTEFGYTINGEKQVITDYSIDLKEIHSQIDNGFGYSKIDRENVKLNKIKASLRKKGYDELRNRPGQNIFRLGSVDGWTDKSKGFVKYSNTGERMTYKEFGESISSKPGKDKLTIDGIYQTYGADGQIKYVAYFDWNGKPEFGNDYVVFEAPKLSDAIDIIKEKVKEDLSILQSKENVINPDVDWYKFNNWINGLYSIHILKQNKSSLHKPGNEKILSTLSKYFKFNDKGYPEVRTLQDDGTYKSKKDVIIDYVKFFNSQLNNPSDDGILSMLSKFWTPMDILPTQSTNIGDKVINDNITTAAYDINMPMAWVDITSISKGVESFNNNNVSNEDKEKPSNKYLDGIGDIKYMKGYPEIISDIYRVNKTNLSRLVYDTLGIKALEDIGFTVDLTNGPTNILGFYFDGKLVFDIDNRGRGDIRSAKHEVFHFIFNKLISEKDRNDLVSEVREHLKNNNLSFSQAEEWMARYIHNKPIDSKYLSPITTVKGLLQRFINAINSIVQKFSRRIKSLDSINEAINNGTYKDISYHEESNSDVVRYMNINSDNFESDMYNDIATEYNKYDKKSSNEKLIETFGELKEINKIRKFLSYAISQESVYSTNINQPLSYSDSFKKIANEFKVHNKDGNYIVSKLNKELKNVTSSEYLSDSLSPSEKQMYIAYHLSNNDIIKSFGKVILPSINEDTFDLTKKTHSTQYDSKKDFNPSDIFDDVFNIEMETIPYRKMVGNKLSEWNRKSMSFVNVADLHKSLKEAGENAMIREKNGATEQFEVLFKEELLKIANSVNTSNDISSNNYKSDYIYSFLAKFYGIPGAGESMASVRNKLSIKGLSMNDDERIKHKAINEFLNNMAGVHKSLYLQKSSSIEIQNKNNDIIRYYEREPYSVIKDEITNKVRTKMFQNGMIQDSFSKYIKDGNPNQLFRIDENGISWAKLGQNIPLITDNNGTLEFTKEFENNKRSYLRTIKNVLGLGNIKTSVLLSMIDEVNLPLNEKSNLKKVREIVPRYKADNNILSRQVIIDGLANMFFAANANIEATNKINDLNAIYKSDINDMSSDKYKKSVDKIINEIPHKKHINKFLDNINVTMSSINTQDEGTFGELDNDLKYATEKIIKPHDFYRFFDVLGAIESYHRGDDYMRFSYSLDGKKRYNYQLNSYLTYNLNDGSSHYRNKVEKLLGDNNILSEMSNKSPFVTNENGKLVFLNEVLDPNGKIESYGLYPLQSMKGIKATGTFTEGDATNGQLRAFFKSVKDSYGKKLQKYTFSLSNISDKGDVFLIPISFDNTNRSERNFISDLELDNEGNISNIKVNNSVVKEFVDKEFKKHKRAHDLSVRRWKNFFNDQLNNQSFSSLGLFRNLIEKGSSISLSNIKDFSNEFIQDFVTLYEIANNENDTRFTKEDYDNFLSDLFSSDLKENADYKASTIKKGDTDINIIEPGIATTFNYINNNENIYTGENYLKWSKQENIGEEFIDELFDKEYRRYASRLKNSGAILPDYVSNLLPKSTSPFYDWNNSELNPLLKAHFHGFEITQQQFGSLVFGDYYDFKGPDDHSKRTGPITTGGSKIVTNIKYGLSNNSKVAIVRDMTITDPITGKQIMVADGQMYGNILFEKFFQSSIGGYQNGPANKTMMKTLYNHVDLVDGSRLQIKHAADFITSDTFNKNPMYRKMQYDMLKATDEAISMLNDDYSPTTLQDKFTEFLKETGEPGKYNVDLAAEKLKNWIEDESGNEHNNSRISHQIKDNLLWGIQNKSGSKLSGSRINNYNFESENINPLSLHNIDNRQISIVLNPYQDINIGKNVKPANQILSYVGVGSNENKIASENIYKALEKIANIEADKMQKEIDDIGIEEWYKKRGLAGFNAMNMAGEIGQLLSDPKISIQDPKIRQILVQMARNYITDNMIKNPFNGIRVNQASGHGFFLFEKDGKTFTYDEVEQAIGSEIDYNEFYSKGIDFEIEGFKPRRLKTMIEGNEEIERAEVGMSYGYASKFGIKKGESLNDVYTIFYENGAKALYDNNSIDQMIDEINGNIDNIDIEKTIVLRHLGEIQNDNWILPSDTEIQNYYKKFDRSLDVFVGRVPANRLGSGAIARIKFFVQDNGNMIYIPPELTVLNDSDFDIDQLSAYHKSVDSEVVFDYKSGPEELSNRLNDINDIDLLQDYIISNIEAVYTNKNNAQDILIESDINGLRDLSQGYIDPKYENTLNEEDKNLIDNNRISKDKRMNDRMNSFATSISNYGKNRSGDEAIGILARSLSASSLLLSIDNDVIFDRIAPGFKNLKRLRNVRGQDSMITRLGNYLQASLDNAKELILGNLGIQYKSAIPTIPILIMEGMNDAEIKAFYLNPTINSIFRDADRGLNIGNRRNDYDIYSILQERIKLANKVSTREYKNALSNKSELDNKLNELYSIASDPETKEETLRQIDKINKSLITVNNTISKYESIDTLNRLEDILTKSEALRRFADFVDNRNGIKALDYDFETRIRNMQQYIGMSLEDIFKKDEKGNYITWDDNTRKDLHMQYFKNNNDDYVYANEDNKEDIYNKELLIAEKLNIIEAVRQFPHINKYAELYKDEQSRVNDFWIYDSKFVKSMALEYLKGRNRLSFDNANIRAGFYKAMDPVFIDLFYKNYDTIVDGYYNPIDNVDIQIPYETEIGTLFKEDGILRRLNLKDSTHRTLFKRHFPQLISFINNISDSGTSYQESLNMTKSLFGNMNDNDAKSAMLRIVNNGFLKKLELNGIDGREKLMLRNNFALNISMIEYLKDEFELLPEELKNLFRHYQIIEYGLKYSKGTMAEVIGPKTMYGMDKAFETFKVFSEDNSKSGISKKNRFKEHFKKYVQHQNNMSPYYNEEIEELENKPEVVIQNRKIRDGFKIRQLLRYDENVGYHEKLGREWLLSDQFSFDDEMNSYDPTVKIESIKMFTSEELAAIKDAKINNKSISINKQFFKGHSYAYGANVITETGDIVKVKSGGKTYSINFTSSPNQDNETLMKDFIESRKDAIKTSSENIIKRKNEFNSLLIEINSLYSNDEFFIKDGEYDLKWLEKKYEESIRVLGSMENFKDFIKETLNSKINKRC